MEPVRDFSAVSGDPLTQVPDHTRLLFEKFHAESAGFSTDAVVGAALNLLVNGIRQRYGTWQEAERALEEWLGRTKEVLSKHYGVSGRRNGIFPFDQTIALDLLDARTKL